MNTTHTVMWFNISAKLSNRALVRKLSSPGLSIENGGGKDLKLIWHRGEAIGCRASDTMLKVFLNKPKFLKTAQKIWKEAGTS